MAANEMECSIYENYSAAEVFVQGLAGTLNQQDVEAMIRAQKKMLQRFEKTNEMLSNCNNLSKTRLERATRDFKAHLTLVTEMKTDLDNVLRRIASIKQRLEQQHPGAFQAAGGVTNPSDEDDEYDVLIRQRKVDQAKDNMQQRDARTEPHPSSS